MTDRGSRNTQRADVIQKEINHARVAFRIPNDDQAIPQGYQFVDCHLVFDVTFDGLKFKARMVVSCQNG